MTWIQREWLVSMVYYQGVWKLQKVFIQFSEIFQRKIKSENFFEFKIQISWACFQSKFFQTMESFLFNIKAYSRLHMLFPLTSPQVILKCHCAKFRGEKFIIVGLDMHIYRPLLHCCLVLISRRSLQNAKKPTILELKLQNLN